MNSHRVIRFTRACAGSAMAALVLAMVTTVSLISVVRAQAQDDHEELKHALTLYTDGRLIEALPLFEHLDQTMPDNTMIKEHLAVALVALAANKADPKESAEIRKRARKLLLQAQAIGDDSNLLHAGLESLPEDGSSVAPSAQTDVDRAIHDGEGAFARGDFAAAIAAYKRALELDPKAYQAALYIGDVYYRNKQLDSASEWFSRAISIEPNSETAYRYWGDSFAQSGKYSDAIVKYIDAIVAEPYRRQSWTGLVEFANHQKIALLRPQVAPPQAQTSSGALPAEMSNEHRADPKDGSAAWPVYSRNRKAWKDERFQREFPNEKEYRHSLNEEAESLGLVASAVEQLIANREIETPDPNLAILVKLKQEGLIEAYVLITAPDEGISQDYNAYRDGHRELIHRYIAEYIAAPLMKTK